MGGRTGAEDSPEEEAVGRGWGGKGVHWEKEVKEPNPYHPVRSQWQDPQGIPHLESQRAAIKTR